MSKQMLKYIEGISKESWLEVQGRVQIPTDKDGKRLPITGASQQVDPPPSVYIEFQYESAGRMYSSRYGEAGLWGCQSSWHGGQGI